MKISHILLFIFLLFVASAVSQQRSFTIEGQVLSRQSREPIPFATITVEGQPSKGAIANEDGCFKLESLTPGIYSLVASRVGYEGAISADVEISATTPRVEIMMEPSTVNNLEEVVVRRSPFERVAQSPVSMQRIGMQQIEKSPGANRDVSRVVSNFAGVAFSPAAYRNDLIVRGGAPSENKFYVDGIEIPNINHFSTQGASGGPVSIINADLIREIDFYTGAFPVDKGGALSSMLDIKLRDGDLDAQNFKATLGASEVALSGDGHFNDKLTYLFSIRQSYLQLLFKALELPFLPNFIDGQLKLNYRPARSHELTLLAIAAVDDMSLNDEATSESAEYILGYLPRIEQQGYTVGLSYRHFLRRHSQRLSLSQSYLNNLNIKYQDNDESIAENLNMDISSRDRRTTLRSDNRSYFDRFTLSYGADVSHTSYHVDSYMRSTVGEDIYVSSIELWDWTLFVGGTYSSTNKRFAASLGGHFAANSFSSSTKELWRQFSPRLSLSYQLEGGFSLSVNSAIYYQMPPLTSLSYQEDGELVNSDLDYINVKQLTLGGAWSPSRELRFSVEGFYKYYSKMPIIIEDDIPLADLGDDYGIVGNEALRQDGHGRAYGVELMARYEKRGRLSLVGAVTLFKSEYKSSADSSYRPSSWDTRYIVNLSGTYFMRDGWSFGAKVSATGAAPYTPYDVDASSNIIDWDISGRPTYDYSQYNTERLDPYVQVDLRVDKVFYFERWKLGLYLDLQNALVDKYREPDIPVSTGVEDSSNPGHYEMKYIESVSGTLLPTFGVTAQF